jgi:hypothetical protein
MYEGILVDVAFAGFFLAKVLPYFSITGLFPGAQSLRFPLVVGSTKFPG